MLGLAFLELFVQLSILLIIYLLLASMRAAFQCPVIFPQWILLHEHPCCRKSTFNHTPETYLCNTRSLVHVNDNVLGN